LNLHDAKPIILNANMARIEGSGTWLTIKFPDKPNRSLSVAPQVVTFSEIVEIDKLLLLTSNIPKHTSLNRGSIN